MKFFLILAIIVVALLLLYLFLALPSLRRSKLLAKLDKRHFAHRGLHDKNIGVPENSMAAFRRALEHGFGFELDVRLTKDKQLVIMHDNATNRMTGVDKLVSESTYAELQTLRLGGTNERIPLFSEVLSLVNGRQALVIEVKTANDCNEVCSAVAKLLDNYKGDFVVESFDPLAVRWFKKHRPQYVRGQLVTRFCRDGEKKVFFDIVESLLLFNVLGRPDFIAINVLDVNTPGTWLNRHIFGAKEFRWTVNNLKDHRAGIDKKASSIFEGFIPEK